VLFDNSRRQGRGELFQAGQVLLSRRGLQGDFRTKKEGAGCWIRSWRGKAVTGRSARFSQDVEWRGSDAGEHLLFLGAGGERSGVELKGKVEDG